MIGLKSRCQHSSCINDTRPAISLTNDNGNQTKAMFHSKTASGVIQTTTLLATLVAKNRTLLILIVDSAIHSAILVGGTLNIIASPVQIMD
jgi:hypothetical protein